jgi:hypothetical protein
MERKNLFNLLAVLGLTIALVGGVVMAHQAEAQPISPQDVSRLEGSIGTGFTYQGRLLDNGTPVDGTCGFTFSLYGSSGGADQIGTTQNKTNVPVENGYFTVADLDFGAGAFDGSERWLEITAGCPSGEPHALLNPRVPLSAAPYAHSLRPGADIVGDIDVGSVVCADNSGNGYGLTGWSAGGHGVRGRSDSTSGYGVYGHSPNGTGVYGKGAVTGTVGIATAGSGVARGVYGESKSTLGTGVKGKASAATGETFGVVGESDSPDGVGVAGYADSSTGTNYGVWGMAFSSDGYGVHGIGDSESGLVPGVVFRKGAGVWGDSDQDPGVYGTSDSDNAVEGMSNSGNGVVGISTSGYGASGFSATGIGVLGTAPMTGTMGTATASGGYGVYGRGPADGFGIYSEGNTHVEGELTWQAKTSYVAVAAAAFHPHQDGYDFRNDGRTLAPEDETSTFYLAPVQLPHGAVVTKVIFSWSDGADPQDGSASLYRVDGMGGETVMATMETQAAGGAYYSTDETINVPTIDNGQYAYYVWLVLPHPDVWAHSVTIEYTITEPY